MLGVFDVSNKVLNKSPTKGYFLLSIRNGVLFLSVKKVCPGSSLGQLGLGQNIPRSPYWPPSHNMSSLTHKIEVKVRVAGREHWIHRSLIGCSSVWKVSRTRGVLRPFGVAKGTYCCCVPHQLSQEWVLIVCSGSLMNIPQGKVLETTIQFLLSLPQGGPWFSQTRYLLSFRHKLLTTVYDPLWNTSIVVITCLVLSSPPGEEMMRYPQGLHHV